MKYTLLNGDVIDLNTISWIGDVGGFGGNSLCYWSGYSYRTYFSDTQRVTISCEPNHEAHKFIAAKVEAEANFIKDYLLKRKTDETKRP